jgi:hypothetical protein
MQMARLILQQIYLTTKSTKMKKILFLVAALLPAVLITDRLYAQDGKDRTDMATTQPVIAKVASTESSSGAPVVHAAAVSSISVRAIKDFKSRFLKVADEQWYPIYKGFCAYFTKDGFKTRAYYDVRGHWQASLTYCDESKLPHFIRDVVKRTYYDLAITFVDIVEVPDHKVYLVHLEDSKTLKIVRVNEEGEMDVRSDFVKTN